MDFLDEMIAERTARNPNFPRLMEQSRQRKQKSSEENRIMNQSVTMYQDNADLSRVVQPIEQSGKDPLCKIFWKTKGGLVYGGTARVPANLFGTDKDLHLKRYGFTPYFRGVE